MNFEDICSIFGNGNPQNGLEMLTLLACKMNLARKNNPVFAEGKFHALGIVAEKFRDFETKIEKSTDKNQENAAIDIAVNTIRFLGKEYEK